MYNTKPPSAMYFVHPFGTYLQSASALFSSSTGRQALGLVTNTRHPSLHRTACAQSNWAPFQYETVFIGIVNSIMKIIWSWYFLIVIMSFIFRSAPVLFELVRQGIINIVTFNSWSQIVNDLGDRYLTIKIPERQSVGICLHARSKPSKSSSGMSPL